MRPDILNPLFAEVETLDGVGPKMKKPLDRLGLTRVRDVAYHLPERFVTRRAVQTVDEAGEGEQIVLKLTVTEHRGGRNPRAPYRVLAQDSIGNVIALTYFGRASYTAKKQLPVGEVRWVAGKLERYGDMLQIVHPDHVLEEGGDTLQRLCEPVYALAEGLTQPRIAGLVEQALARAPELPEWNDASQVEREDWPKWREALKAAHKGEDAKARDRLAYDELFANSLAMLVRADNRRRKGQPLVGDGSYRGKLALPFPLTGAQKRSIAEIEGDLAQEAPMLRLLQGDVGAGKTVVALEAMLIAVEAGAQAALLAPTELLARQHYETLRRMAAPTGAEVVLFTGRDKGRARESILMGLLDGSIDIVVGTHAIFQDTVAYRNLAMVVIDEQHRFGVGQRLMLAGKGKRAPHVLAMTATPIPRTLTLAQYGELDVSKLDELPPGRQAIDTVVMGQDKTGLLVDRLAAQIAEGRQAYWVCPMVRESDGPEEIAAAEARYAALRERFGEDVVMVHGQLAPELKDAAMERFASGDAKLLVATTVIEVGVDVPNATLMVIEQAERFGLAQLHQLRGRVGRGSAKSICILLRGDTLSETARERLALMRDTQDGFQLAEEDLRLRGGGELLGTRQSGDAAFRIADLEQITRLLPAAHDDARLLMERDGGLEGSRGEAARILLYLFERDFGVRTLRGG